MKKELQKTACQNSENCHSSVHFIIFFYKQTIMVGKFSGRSYINTHPWQREIYALDIV